MDARELARRAISRPMTERRAQKLRDRIDRKRSDAESYALDVLNAIESQHGIETRNQVAEHLAKTRNRRLPWSR